MPSEARAGQQHLHPLTLAFNLVSLIRGFMIPLAVAVFARGVLAGVILFGLVTSAITMLIRYLTFTYRIGETELVTAHGLLQRTERHIPIERIQDVKLEQRPLHRLLGVAKVEVETAGGQQAEAVLEVIGLADAERLRRALLDARQGTRPDATPAGPPEELLARVPARDLLIAGLTSNRASMLLVLMMFLLGQAEDLVPDLWERLAGWIGPLADRIAASDPRAVLWGVGLLVAGVLIIGLVLSVATSFLLYSGFRLALKGDDLQRRYGLLTSRASSLPRRRIQCLRVDQGWLRRLLGLAALRAVSAGSRQDEATEDGRDILLPIGRIEQLPALLTRVMPGLPEQIPPWQAVSPRAVGRTFRKSVVLLGVAVALSARALGLHALWGLLLIPLAYVAARQSFRHLGYALGPAHLWIKRGWLGRTTYVIPIARIQSASVGQTPFDRRLGLARLRVDTAGSPLLGGPELPNLPVGEALSLARELGQAAAETRFAWS